METSLIPNKYFARVKESADFLHKTYGDAPDLCIVLGSGLSGAIPNIDSMAFSGYENIPGFARVSVAGHAGDLRVGEISAADTDGIMRKRKMVFLRGRNHAYEGYDAGEVVHNLRSVITWGVKGVILTNAAGCLHPEWELGRMMIISDHINATGMSPLTGEAGAPFGARFVDMSESYTSSWQEKFMHTALTIGHTVYRGVYYGVYGCQYETPAEIKMMQILGASAVGMSTVLETIAARQLGVKVAGISCLTNYASGLVPHAHLEHTEVMEMGKRFAHDMAEIILKTAVTLEV